MVEHPWAVHISGDSDDRGDQMLDSKALGHLGQPMGRRTEQMRSPRKCGGGESTSSSEMRTNRCSGLRQGQGPRRAATDRTRGNNL